MMRPLLFVYLLLLLIVPTTSHASGDGIDGSKLLENCESVIDRPQSLGVSEGVGIGWCLGLLNGLVSVNQVYQDRLGNESLFCLPEGGISNLQAARVVIKFLRDNPARLHEKGTFLALVALKDAFPCKTSAQK